MEINLYSLFPSEIHQFISPNNEYPKFRAEQIFQWLYKEIKSFDEMGNLPKSLRSDLNTRLSFPKMKILNNQESKDATQKFLLQCPFDENLLEVVLMTYKFGKSVCISTQVGCAMHCAFCASGKHGLIRNLSAGEMIQEILTIQHEIHERISNVVLMGMGEPLDNFEETIKFLKLVHFPKGLNIGYRHITLSTCGIIPKIYKLAEMEFPITLAISLHAPNNELRNKLMPINRKYPIEDLIEACQFYQEKTGRRITFEYALIDGVNDTTEHMQQLVILIRPLLAHVNLIPLNRTDSIYSQSKTSKVQEFFNYLEIHHIPCTIRRQMGADIDAACGQLRNRYLSKF